MAISMATASTGLATSSSGAPRQQKGRGFVAQIGRAVMSAAQSFAAFFDALATARQAAGSYEYLAHLSDAELAAHGIERQDIPHYVFERYYNRRT